MSTTRNAGRPWTRTTLAVFARDGWRCRWCNRPVHRTLHCLAKGCALCAHGDHWPVGAAEGLAMGWGWERINDPANVVTACRRCNQGRAGGQRAALRRRRRDSERRSGLVGGSSLTSASGNPTCSAFPPLGNAAVSVNRW